MQGFGGTFVSHVREGEGGEETEVADGARAVMAGQLQQEVIKKIMCEA